MVDIIIKLTIKFWKMKKINVVQNVKSTYFQLLPPYLFLPTFSLFLTLLSSLLSLLSSFSLRITPLFSNIYTLFFLYSIFEFNTFRMDSSIWPKEKEKKHAFKIYNKNENFHCSTENNCFIEIRVIT